MLTQERLKELLNYNSASGVFTWIIKVKGRKVGGVAGRTSGKYQAIGIDGCRYYSHRLAWLYVYGEFPQYMIDHIDRNRFNNRISNLRAVTSAENLQNQIHPRWNNKSGLMGCRFHKKSNLFHSRITTNGKTISLGYFKTAEEAHTAYINAKRKHHKTCTL